MYKIVVADDSALVRKVLCDIIDADPDFQVAETCTDGLSAYEYATKGVCDCLVMEMYLPKMSSVEVIHQLHEEGAKIPIIVITSSLKEDADATAAAKDYGMASFVVRPFRLFSDDREVFEEKLVEALVKSLRIERMKKPFVRSTDGTKNFEPAPRTGVERTPKRAPDRPVERTEKSTSNVSRIKGKSAEVFRGKKRLVAIASSTGGPQALHTMVPMLPKLNVPVVIVQHMPKGFTESLAERIDQKSAMRIKEAEDGEILQPNVVYLAPGGRHLEIKENANGQHACRVFDDPPVNNLRPCADVMYKSLEKCSFDEILCVVLTGMGQDGSDGIASLGQKKKIYTITQSEDTCVVYGMPKAADQRGLSNESASIKNIANVIAKKLGV